MKRRLLIIAIISLAISVSACTKNNVTPAINKIGIVNVATVFQATPQGENRFKELQKKLNSQIEKLQQEQDNVLQEEEIIADNTLQEEEIIADTVPVIKGEDLKDKETGHMYKEQKFEQAFDKIRQNGSEQENKLLQNFQEDLTTAISEIAKQEDYDLILNIQAISYIKPIMEHDVTIPIIKKMKSLSKHSMTESNYSTTESS